jgi:hypothetical protein
MDAINRSAVIVMPAQPFLDWLHRADPTSAALSLEDLRREPTIYRILYNRKKGMVFRGQRDPQTLDRYE